MRRLVFNDSIPYAFQTETQNLKPLGSRVHIYIGLESLRMFGV